MWFLALRPFSADERVFPDIEIEAKAQYYGIRTDTQKIVFIENTTSDILGKNW